MYVCDLANTRLCTLKLPSCFLAPPFDLSTNFVFTIVSVYQELHLVVISHPLLFDYLLYVNIS